MRRLVIFYILFFLFIGVFAQSKPLPVPNPSNRQSLAPDSVKSKADTTGHKRQKAKPSESVKTDASRSLQKKMIQSPDTLTMSDYTLSLERVNDNLISISDSAKLGFDVVKIARRIATMTNDVKLIRQNMRGRNTVFNIKNQFLYQSFTAKLDEETDRIQERLNELHGRVYHARLHLNVVLNDSIFRKLYANKTLRTAFDQKLIRLERRYSRTDSLTKANVDTLNALNVRLSDNSYNLSNMLNILDNRMDKAVPKLFGPEVNRLWGKESAEVETKETSKNAVSIFDSEQNAIGYYFSQTSGERKIVLILGILLFTWLFFRRKLLKTVREQKETYSYLNLKYLNNFPALSMLVFLLSLMPFFDAYAPTSYISIVFLFLLTASTVIFYKRGNPTFLFNWFALAALFVVDVLTYLLIEPTFAERLLLLAVHSCIIVFTYSLYRSLHKETPFYRFIKMAALTAIILSCLGILFNLFGRFSLSGMVGVAAIIAVTQAVVLAVFVEVIIEIVLLQLLSSRLDKGLDKPFETSIIISKIRVPLILIAMLVWLIMLTSNLNIYHSITQWITEALTTTRTIGSISFQWLSAILFFAIIWIAHILQRLIIYLFGETGSGAEDMTTITKAQHSRLLITRLLVLMGGYMLAIAASGLPIDKLTFLLGALGVGIGMGLQGIVNNVVSGIILIFEGSLQIGDEIEASGQAGKVKEIGLRSSTLTTADGADVIIPNGNILSQNIVNWTFSKVEKRIMLSFSLSGKELDSNVINDLINETIMNIPNVLSKRKPEILYTKVTPESCMLSIRFWSTITNVDLVKSEAMLQLSAAFAAKKVGFE